MRVTIYIPTHNRLSFLRRAINSVLEQDYPDIELIVVNDASDDGTREYLNACESRHELRAIHLEQNSGACIARNCAIKASQGMFLTGLDDDDYFTNTSKISRFVARWKSESGRIAGLFDSVKCVENGLNIEHFTRSFVSDMDLRISNYVGNQVFAPKHHYVEAGFFDPEMPAWQDWDLWLRMSKQYGGFFNIQLFGTYVNKDPMLERISTKPQTILREAMIRLLSKMGPMSARERSYFITALHAYPQVKPTISELITVLAGRRLHESFKSMIKLF